MTGATATSSSDTFSSSWRNGKARHYVFGKDRQKLETPRRVDLVRVLASVTSECVTQDRHYLPKG
jgi:hypothetical protein